MTKTRLIARVSEMADKLESLVTWIDRDLDEEGRILEDFSETEIANIKHELRDESKSLTDLAKRLMN